MGVKLGGINFLEAKRAEGVADCSVCACTQCFMRKCFLKYDFKVNQVKGYYFFPPTHHTIEFSNKLL